MIPQRVAIEGFLSYRRQVEFCFNDAPIWMLTGKNGAGKSSVFDAITFALYGVHRGGRDEVKELINRNSDRLSVEFDFSLGTDHYRVQRTVARRGGPTFQAWHLSGPNPPNRRVKGEQLIAGTDSKAGLTNWVKRKLGLDHEAFKMAVLLEQGKSDALLSAEPKERHKLLSQLVDLRRYVALEAEAKKRQNDENSTVKSNKAELATLSDVTPLQIAAQEERVAGVKRQIDLVQQRLGQLQALMVYAERWDKLGSRRDQALSTLESMRALLADGGQIEKAALRLDDLRATLPVLRRVLQHSQNRQRRQDEAGLYRQKAAQAAANVAEATPHLVDAQLQAKQLQAERDAAQSAQNGALQRLNDLSAAIHDLDAMGRLCQQMAACDEQLARFASDLDQQVAQAEADADEGRLLKMLWPYVQQYVGARTSWLEAGAKLEAARQKQEDDSRFVAQAMALLEQARTLAVQADEEAAGAQSQALVAGRVLEDAAEQLRKFEEVGAQPVCPYCGQPLSREHLVTERARLEEMIAARTAAANGAQEVLAVARKKASDAAAVLNHCQVELERGQKEQRESQSRCQNLAGERTRAEGDGRRAVEGVRANHAPAFMLPSADEIALCFAQPAPTLDDLALLKGRVQGLGAVESALKGLRAKAAEREQFCTSRRQLESQYQPLAIRYPEERGRAIRDEYALAADQKEEARSRLARVMSQFDDAQAKARLFETALQRAKADQEEAEREAHHAAQMAQESQVYWQQEIDALDPVWQEAARGVEDGQIARWQGELDALKDAGRRLEELHTARSQIALVEANLAGIESELAQIPQEARQEVVRLQQEEAQGRACQAEKEEEHRAAAAELAELEKRQQRIQELTIATRAAERKAAHYKLIAQHLGSDYLQRFLLQQAESAIVGRANDVLDRCSGGALSMVLRPQPKEGSLQKAFDLMVENYDTQSDHAKMLPAWLLSGSQRFRVAISLALAIGHYASSNGQGIESVIIDEGFGSLDRQGLRDMEEALRGLEKMIRRIILVSHQEEFANAFPHRYAVWLEDGASQAGLADAGLEG